MGTYNRDFASKWKGKAEQKFGRGGSEILKVKDKAGLKKMQAAVVSLLEDTRRAAGGIKGGKESISKYSEWLATFDGLSSSANGGDSGSGVRRREDKLEIPGMYWWPHEAPPPTTPNRISFSEALSAVLPKPKRIGLLGDDEKSTSSSSRAARICATTSASSRSPNAHEQLFSPRTGRRRMRGWRAFEPTA